MRKIFGSLGGFLFDSMLGLTRFGLAPDGGGASAAPAVQRFRIREDLPAFVNVVATGRASCTIPRYSRTLLRITLQLGGTTFTKALITEIRLKLGAKTLWLTTGSDLDRMNKWEGIADDANFLTLDFTQPRHKERGGEFIGGIDMTSLPAGDLILECVITGATAPTLNAKASWGQPQANPLMLRLLQFTVPITGAGRFALPLQFGGALVQRLFFLYGGADFVTTAVASAWAGNVGNGVMGAITVSNGAKVGTYKLVITEIIANAAAFNIEDPDGKIMSRGGAVAAAYNFGGLAFTLADGAADYVPGDGFDIVVSGATNGNVSRVEVNKDAQPQWNMTCSESRFLAREYLKVPQGRLYVADFVADNGNDGILKTADAKSIEVFATMLGADTLTVYAEALCTPDQI